MKNSFENKMRILGACGLFALGAAWLPVAQAQSAASGEKMLKNEMIAAGQMKLDAVTRAKLMAVIRELEAKYSTWEQNNGADMRRMMEESRKGAISDAGRMVELMEEHKKIKAEIKEKISKELTPEQYSVFNSAVNALKVKDAQKPATAGPAAKPGMTPREALITLGLPSERAAELKALIVDHEMKTAEAARKRSEMMAEAKTLSESKVVQERTQGTAKARDAQKIKGPPVSELDDQIMEKLSPESAEIYRKLRAGEETGKARETAAKVVIQRMIDGEFNRLCDMVFPLAEQAGGKAEMSLRSKVVLDGLVKAMTPESTKYSQATRMTLLEVPEGTEIVDRPMRELSLNQLNELAGHLREMISQFRSAKSDKDKREAFCLGFSKAVNVLSVEQRVWVVNEAERERRDER